MCPGLLGTMADGRAVEIDPSQRGRRGVSILLGRLPGVVPAVVSDAQALAPGGDSTAAAAGRGQASASAAGGCGLGALIKAACLQLTSPDNGLGHPPLAISSLMLLFRHTSTTLENLEGRDGFLEWLARELPVSVR